MQNLGLTYVAQIIDYLERLAGTEPYRSITTYASEKEYILLQVKEGRYYLKYNEWIVGLEMILDNLGEIDYKPDEYCMELIKKAIDLAAIYYPQIHERYRWIDELKK